MKFNNTTKKAFILSFLSYCGLSVSLSPISEASTIKDLLCICVNQFNGFSVPGAFLFLGLFLFFQKTVSAVETEKETLLKKVSLLKSEMILSALFSFFIITGTSFANTNSAILMYGFQNGQIIKVVTVFMGYFILFFYGITYLFHCWNRYSNGEILLCSSGGETEKDSHPFLIVFLVLAVTYLPRAIISFPAIVMGDTPWQIAQAFPELSYSRIAEIVPEVSPAQYVTPQSKLLSESVYINMHHPVAHTLLLHACICLGHAVLKSWNAGLYIYTLLQGLLFLTAVSYSIAVLIRNKVINGKYVWLLIAYYFIHPQIHSYLFLATKDVLYAAFFVLFLTHWFLLIRGANDKRTVFILVISIIGMLLFRNESKYVLLVFLAVSLVIYKPVRRKAEMLLGTVLVFSLLVFQILFPALNYNPGSIREMLSVPFQQTARYVHYWQDEITEEEREAIDKVLDYDSLSEKYNPNFSDPVKSTFRETAEAGDLKQYFKYWFKMFLKHPMTYVSATVNNYYEYCCPVPDRYLRQYTYSWSNRTLQNTNKIIEPLGIAFSYPSRFASIRILSDKWIKALNHFPFISVLMTPAFYVWTILLLLFYAVKRRNLQLCNFIMFPFLVILVCFVGPTNGNYGRYLFPMSVVLPLLISMSISITKHASLSTNFKQPTHGGA